MATNKERSSATKNKILFSVFKLMSKGFGWEGISVNDLEKELGMTRGALFHHYANKSVLFQAAVDKYYFGRFTAENVPEEYRVSLHGFYRQLCKMLSEYLIRMEDEGIENPERAVSKIELTVTDEIPGFRERCLDKYMDEKAVWNMVVCNAIRSGEIKSMNPLILTNLFFTTYIGCLKMASIYNQRIDIHSLKQQMDTLYALVAMSEISDNKNGCDSDEDDLVQLGLDSCGD